MFFSGWDLSSVDDIECIGITQGIIGAISLPGVYDPHLVIIKESQVFFHLIPNSPRKNHHISLQAVGSLYGTNLVYKIKSVCILSMEEPDTILTPCLKHCTNRAVIVAAQTVNTSPPGKSKLFDSSLLMNKTWGVMKSAGSTIKSTTQQAAVLATNQVKSKVGIKDPTRLEKRITDELHKIFDDTDSFYYCLEGDITNNLQRKDDKIPDDRFFWNKHMIKDIMKLERPDVSILFKYLLLSN